MTKTITLRSGDLALRLGCRGGVILDFRLGAGALMRPTPEGAAPGDSACFPLVPLGNRIRDNRFDFGGKTYRVTPNALPEPLHLHGAGWQADWDLAGSDQSSARLTHRYDGPDLPHQYEAVQSFALTPGSLTITMSVTNIGADTLPFGIGWHPFFLPGAVLTAPAQGVWTEGPGHLPDGRTVLPEDLDFAQPRPLPGRWINNAFDGWSGHARIDWPQRGLSLRISADPVFGCYQLYAPQDGAPFAFEPMSHLPDALSRPGHGGLTPLAPGESLAGSITLVPSSLPGAAGAVSGEKS